MTENELLAELTKELKKEERLPGDVSVKDLSIATGLSIKQCNDILNKKANSGQLIKVSVCGKPGDPKFVYRKPPDL